MRTLFGHSLIFFFNVAASQKRFHVFSPLEIWNVEANPWPFQSVSGSHQPKIVSLFNVQPWPLAAHTEPDWRPLKDNSSCGPFWQRGASPDPVHYFCLGVPVVSLTSQLKWLFVARKGIRVRLRLWEVWGEGGLVEVTAVLFVRLWFDAFVGQPGFMEGSPVLPRGGRNWPTTWVTKLLLFVRLCSFYTSTVGPLYVTLAGCLRLKLQPQLHGACHLGFRGGRFPPDA